MSKWGSQYLTYAYDFHEPGWGTDRTNQPWHHPSASPVAIVWTMVGQHLFLNVIPNNFTVDTRRKYWCDHGMSLHIMCLHSWVWNFTEVIVFYQGDHKNILICDIDGKYYRSMYLHPRANPWWVFEPKIFGNIKIFNQFKISTWRMT